MGLDCGLSQTKFMSDFGSLKMPRDPFQTEAFFRSEAVRHNRIIPIRFESNSSETPLSETRISAHINQLIC